MALGGWPSYDATKPYLAATMEWNIIQSMRGAELEVSFPPVERQSEEDLGA